MPLSLLPLGITLGAQLLTPVGAITTAIASNQSDEAVNFLFGEGNAGGIVLAILIPIVLIAILIVAIRVLASMRKEEKIKSKVDVRVQQENAERQALPCAECHTRRHHRHLDCGDSWWLGNHD